MKFSYMSLRGGLRLVTYLNKVYAWFKKGLRFKQLQMIYCVNVGYEEGLCLSGVGLSPNYHAQVKLPSYMGGDGDTHGIHFSHIRIVVTFPSGGIH
jgi:hypothetical protein